MISLRAIDILDAKCIYELIDENRVYLSKYLYWVNNIQSIEDEIAGITGMIKRSHQGVEFCFVIIEQNMNHTIGMIGITNIDYKLKECDCGYWIAEKYSGNGYARQALLCIESFVRQHKIKKIILKCDDDNIASIKVAEKCKYELFATNNKENCISNDATSELIYRKIIC